MKNEFGGDKKRLIKQVGLEVEALHLEAQRLKLPGDIPALLKSWLRHAEELSDELPQKPTIKKLLLVALNDFEFNDMQQVRFHILVAMKLFEDAKHDKWVLGIQKQFGRNRKELLKRSEEVVKPKHEEWRRLAVLIQKESARKLSKYELSVRIKKRLDERTPEKSGAIDYIRKVISKKIK